MCECLENEDGTMFLCEVCAAIWRGAEIKLQDAALIGDKIAKLLKDYDYIPAVKTVIGLANELCPQYDMFFTSDPNITPADVDRMFMEGGMRESGSVTVSEEPLKKDDDDEC